MEIEKNYSYSLPFWSLLRKEILRFLTVPLQAIVAPIVTSSLFILVFGLSMGNRISVTLDIPYIQFVVPGLILQGIITNSFANSSSSLFFSRYIGNIVDLLVTPITARQMILAYTTAAIIRGMIVGVAILGVSIFFTSLPWVHPFAAILMAVLTSFTLSQLGIIAAIYSDTFEAISMYTNFLLLPLIYLGGMFYPVSILPPFWERLSQINPLHYTIDGFRSAILGSGDASLATSFAVTSGFAILLFIWSSWLLTTGHRIRK